MDGSKKWYVVYTHTGCEKKLAENLSRRKIENYFPLNKMVCENNYRKPIINVPLFNSYVFVRISESELLILKNTVGVINVVYWLDKPVVIRDSEIEMIKKVLNDHRNVKLEKTSRQPVTGQEGQIFSIKNKTIKIMLPSLGYFMVAEEETTDEGVSVRIFADQNDSPSPKYVTK